MHCIYTTSQRETHKQFEGNEQFYQNIGARMVTENKFG